MKVACGYVCFCYCFNPDFFDFQKQSFFPNMKVKEAWIAGFTGRNISVTILDDGIERDHPDLIANYVSQGFDVPQHLHCCRLSSTIGISY